MLQKKMRTLACVAATVVSMASAHAAESVLPGSEVLLQGKNGITITMNDVLADLQQRVEPEVHAQVLANEPVLRQIVSNLYVFRTLGQRAAQQGMGQDPVTLARLQILQDRVLGTTWLADQDQRSRLDEPTAMAQALLIYKASPERWVEQPEQVRARHILLKGKDDAARQKAADLLTQLKNGADFAELAKTESADPGSAARGGDLGQFGRGKMVPEFEKAVFALEKPGDFADVVESQFGLHIIQLQERIPEKILSFGEVSDMLVTEVQAKSAQNARLQTADAIRAQGQFNDQAVKALIQANAKLVEQAKQQAKQQPAAAVQP